MEYSVKTSPTLPIPQQLEEWYTTDGWLLVTIVKINDDYVIYLRRPRYEETY